ncbi:hypothetical protein TraAM80_08845, partial [Trypanosoma rangeli]
MNIAPRFHGKRVSPKSEATFGAPELCSSVSPNRVPRSGKRQAGETGTNQLRGQRKKKHTHRENHREAGNWTPMRTPQRLSIRRFPRRRRHFFLVLVLLLLVVVGADVRERATKNHLHRQPHNQRKPVHLQPLQHHLQ